MKTIKLRYLASKKWHDEDELLIHAMFEVLSQFVEYNRKHQIINWDNDSQHKHAWKEMTEMYDWWIKRQERDKNNPLYNPDVKAPSFKFTKTGEKMFNSLTKKTEELSKMDFVYKSDKDKQKWNKAPAPERA